MSLTTSRRRLALRAAAATTATAALAGTAMAPAATAFADTATVAPVSDGGSPETPVACVVTIHQDIGAGLEALLTIAPSGPSVVFRSFGDGRVFETLDRKHPELPARAGIIGEILDPDGPTPQLRTAVEGGGRPAGVTDFPKLPKGCGDDGSGTGATVVPKGGVAAGAVRERSHDGLVTAGGVAAALGAAGIGFVALRRRTAAAGR
ncbi:hypothetical protein [Streptomyces sp. NPDC001876]|uniref:hypothetical protein n=1 Tax=Streptomyces sp. NPDC001876 TaxID=3154402 RepID=UPI003317168E